jgi:Fe-S-cluster-containing hydrogenase component 2
MSVISNGYLEYAELEEKQELPTLERYAKGPVAIIECVQEIPCNPCEAACKFGALKVGTPITNIPVLDGDKCTGCGICVANCSGLCIFIVDKSYDDKLAKVSFPHEYYPLPKKEDVVEAVNRKGEYVCNGIVTKVLNPKSFDRTPVVTVEIPIEFSDEVRGMKRSV